MPKAKTQFTGAWELFTKSYQLIVKNWKVFAVLYLLPFLGALPSASTEVGEPTKVLWPLIIGFILLAPLFLAVFAIIYTMLLQLELDVAGGKKPSLGQIWDRLKPRFWRLIGLGLLLAVMVVGGLILLIIPGLFVIQRFLLSPYFLLDKDLSITDALKKSAAAAKKHSTPVWVVVGVILLFAVISSLPGLFGLVGFLLSVLFSVAPAIRYREIKKAS